MGTTKKTGDPSASQLLTSEKVVFCKMALISPQDCPWPQKSELIVLTAVSSKPGLKSFPQLQASPDHEEAKGDALRTVLEQGGRVLVVLLRLHWRVVQHRRQQVHLQDFFHLFSRFFAISHTDFEI